MGEKHRTSMKEVGWKVAAQAHIHLNWFIQTCLADVPKVRFWESYHNPQSWLIKMGCLQLRLDYVPRDSFGHILPVCTTCINNVLQGKLCFCLVPPRCQLVLQGQQFTRAPSFTTRFQLIGYVYCILSCSSFPPRGGGTFPRWCLLAGNVRGRAPGGSCRPNRSLFKSFRASWLLLPMPFVCFCA